MNEKLSDRTTDELMQMVAAPDFCGDAVLRDAVDELRERGVDVPDPEPTPAAAPAGGDDETAATLAAVLAELRALRKSGVEVTLRDVNIPFTDLMGLIVRIMLASIPAAIVVTLLVWLLIAVIFGGGCWLLY